MLSALERKWLTNRKACKGGITFADKHNSLADAWESDAKRSRTFIAWASLPYEAVDRAIVEGCMCRICCPTFESLPGNPFKSARYQKQLAAIKKSLRKKPTKGKSK